MYSFLNKQRPTLTSWIVTEYICVKNAKEKTTTTNYSILLYIIIGFAENSTMRTRKTPELKAHYRNCWQNVSFWTNRSTTKWNRRIPKWQRDNKKQWKTGWLKQNQIWIICKRVKAHNPGPGHSKPHIHYTHSKPLIFIFLTEVLARDNDTHDM